MAFDPRNNEIIDAQTPAIPDGHYALRADDFDGPSIDAAQIRAAEAAMRLNLLPADQRTPEAIMEVRELSDLAGSLAIDANAARVIGPADGLL